MSFEIQQITKHITQQQVIERIDYRFNEYIPTLESKIDGMSDKITQIEECSKNTTNEMDALKTKCSELQQKCDGLIVRDIEISKQNKILNDIIEQLKTDRIVQIEKRAEEYSKKSVNEINALNALFTGLQSQCDELQKTNVAIRSENHAIVQYFENTTKGINEIRTKFIELQKRCEQESARKQNGSKFPQPSRTLGLMS
jgi:chromosome segregation ATPase